MSNLNKLKEIFMGTQTKKSSGNLNEIMESEFKDYDVILGLDLAPFNEHPNMQQITPSYGMDMGLGGEIYYLVNSEDIGQRSIIFLPDGNNSSDFEVIHDADDIAKAEKIFASCLFTGTHEISQKYIENAHLYLDMDTILPYFGIEV